MGEQYQATEHLQPGIIRPLDPGSAFWLQLLRAELCGVKRFNFKPKYAVPRMLNCLLYFMKWRWRKAAKRDYIYIYKYSAQSRCIHCNECTVTRFIQLYTVSNSNIHCTVLHFFSYTLLVIFFDWIKTLL